MELMRYPLERDDQDDIDLIWCDICRMFVARMNEEGTHEC